MMFMPGREERQQHCQNLPNPLVCFSATSSITIEDPVIAKANDREESARHPRQLEFSTKLCLANHIPLL
eukprot:scaffold118611_cov50-Prasinocladus_malaysianus.AAC.3